MRELAKTTGLFALTAVAEIIGCYLPWLVLKQGKSAWLLVPAVVALALFVWLLRPASLRGWAHLRRVWRHVYHRCADMVMGSRWHYSLTLGSDRRNRGFAWHGHHCVTALT